MDASVFVLPRREKASLEAIIRHPAMRRNLPNSLAIMDNFKPEGEHETIVANFFLRQYLCAEGDEQLFIDAFNIVRESPWAIEMNLPDQTIGSKAAIESGWSYGDALLPPIIEAIKENGRPLTERHRILKDFEEKMRQISDLPKYRKSSHVFKLEWSGEISYINSIIWSRKLLKEIEKNLIEVEEYYVQTLGQGAYG